MDEDSWLSLLLIFVLMMFGAYFAASEIALSSVNKIRIRLLADRGDRAAGCGGLMEPVSVWVRKNGEWALIHRCRRCGAMSSNRIAADDNPLKLMSIALKPLAEPPFPVERLRELDAALSADDAVK